MLRRESALFGRLIVEKANIVNLRERQKPPRRVFGKLSKVLTDPDLPLRTNERLVALVIFQHVNLKTMKCWPTIHTISRRAKVTRNTVCKTIKKMEKMGLVNVAKERKGGRFQQSIYDFTPILGRVYQVREGVRGD